MSDIEILLREISEKLDVINTKLDKIYYKDNTKRHIRTDVNWGDDSIPDYIKEQIDKERKTTDEQN